MSIPHPFPYQGSKRKIAPTILQYIPTTMGTFYEPFAGSGAVTLAVANSNRANYFVLNDSNDALMHLWQAIVSNPQSIADQYEHLWHEQLGNEKAYYFAIRSAFNSSREPHFLLYLLARCVKAAIRYNAKGEFNQSCDNRRKGMHPNKMRLNLVRVSKLLKDKVKISSTDYREIIREISATDILYMDPPYQGVAGKNPRYAQSLLFDEFVQSLEELNNRHIAYIVSYDGKNGDVKYGNDLPDHLKLHRLNVNAGRSTQSTLLGQSASTIESLYISNPLWETLDTAKLQQLQFDFYI